MAYSVFPWRRGNAVSLLVDGPCFFAQMLTRINAAQRHVELELYLLESGACATALLDALCAAAERGVAVRCLFDGYGAQGLLLADRQRLEAAGIQVRWYNPVRWRHGVRNFHRDHRKVLVVDEQFAFVGGTGATDAFWQPGEAESRWHEVMVEISGPLVADWLQLFERQWQVDQSWIVWRPRLPLRVKTLLAIPAVGDGLGRVAFADAVQHRDILFSLVRMLRSSKRRIWLATPYFLPTWRVRRVLRQAAARGVDVRLLLAGNNTDHPPIRFAGQRYYASLLKAGVQIFEYQPRFLHLKMVLVDDWVSIGSCNFDHWNLRFNLDANLEALDPSFTASVAACFERDFADSQLIDGKAWLARPWYIRVQQKVWGILDQLMFKLLNRRR
ncbi:phospholipase D-like domain-containing protein [Pseudomonas sp. GWSMS-1]|uniref:phospholipase D-like domain-containing protein n=1 Tax=Pseudomonas sp. GWSMS-1 TaxID=3308997 RepID=UPI003CF60A05